MLLKAALPTAVIAMSMLTLSACGSDSKESDEHENSSPAVALTEAGETRDALTAALATYKGGDRTAAEDAGRRGVRLALRGGRGPARQARTPSSRRSLEEAISTRPARGDEGRQARRARSRRRSRRSSPTSTRRRPRCDEPRRARALAVLRARRSPRRPRPRDASGGDQLARGRHEMTLARAQVVRARSTRLQGRRPRRGLHARPQRLPRPLRVRRDPAAPAQPEPRARHRVQVRRAAQRHPRRRVRSATCARARVDAARRAARRRPRARRARASPRRRSRSASRSRSSSARASRRCC